MIIETMEQCMSNLALARAEIDRLRDDLIEAEKYNGWHQQAVMECDRLRAQEGELRDRIASLERLATTKGSMLFFKELMEKLGLLRAENERLRKQVSKTNVEVRSEECDRLRARNDELEQFIIGVADRKEENDRLRAENESRQQLIEAQHDCMRTDSEECDRLRAGNAELLDFIGSIADAEELAGHSMMRLVNEARAILAKTAKEGGTTSAASDQGSQTPE